MSQPYRRTTGRVERGVYDAKAPPIATEPDDFQLAVPRYRSTEEMEPRIRRRRQNADRAKTERNILIILSILCVGVFSYLFYAGLI
ncbi:MAG: hypothetical protein AAGC74_01605 [Verrucomicrobiota bacterium]